MIWDVVEDGVIWNAREKGALQDAVEAIAKISSAVPMFVNKVVLVVSVILNAREAAAVKVAPEATVIFSVRVMHARVNKVVPEEAAPKVQFNWHDLCNSALFVAVCQQSPLYCKQLYIRGITELL